VFDAFIERTTAGDPELAGYVQRAFGYAITGDPCEERLFFVHGPTASGKSTLLEALKSTLGEYASTADFSTFIKSRRDSTIRNDIARLAGVRLVLSIEVDEGKALAEGVVKAVTGGDTVTARFLYKEHFEFVPAFTLVLAANRRPRVSAADRAMWRRISVVPFTSTVPEAERDPAVKRTLKDDPEARSAILAWLVQGCLNWQRNGLQEPEIVRAYTAEYRAENDLLREWIEDCARLDPAAVTLSSRLLISYARWAEENGREPLTANQLAATLLEHGFEPSRVHGGRRGWRGLRLTTDGDTR